jgi:hypothetical protein
MAGIRSNDLIPAIFLWIVAPLDRLGEAVAGQRTPEGRRADQLGLGPGHVPLSPPVLAFFSILGCCVSVLRPTGMAVPSTLFHVKHLTGTFHVKH